MLFFYLKTIDSKKITEELNINFFPFYSTLVEKVKSVVKENLNDQVIDQLVLIENVFKKFYILRLYCINISSYFCVLFFSNNFFNYC